MDAPTERGLLDTNLVLQVSHVDPPDLPLYTANPDDFVGITDLDLRSVATAIPPTRSES